MRSAVLLGLLVAAHAGATPPLTCPRDVPVPGVERAYIDIHGATLHTRRWAERHQRLLRDSLEQGDAALEARSLLEAELREDTGAPHARVEVIRYHTDEGEWRYTTLDVWSDTSTRRIPEGPPHDDPEGLVERWLTYEAIGWRLLRAGEVRPARTCGALHCLFGFQHPELTSFGPVFARDVPTQAEALGLVLRADPDPERRAAAAFLLGHHDDAPAAVTLLMPGIDDPSPKVRNNAIRVLIHIARAHPEVDIDLGAVAALLDMEVVTDRNKALVLAATLSKGRPEVARRFVLHGGDALIQALRSASPLVRDPAWETLSQARGAPLSRCKVGRWTRWVRRIQETSRRHAIHDPSSAARRTDSVHNPDCSLTVFGSRSRLGP